MNRDIKVACVATISDALRTAFETKDRFGNPSVDMATAKPVSLINGSGFAQCYNLLTGYGSSVLAANGEVAELNSRLWPVYDLETLDIMSKWDVDGNWIMECDIINSMLGIYNPDITNEDMQAVVDSVTYETTLARLG